SFTQPGTPAPVLTLERLAGGERTFPVKGKWTLVFFWSLFCHVCIEELPMLAEEVAALPKESVEAVFVSIDTSRLKTGLENYLRKRNLSVEVVLDRIIASASYEAADAWGVRPTPAVFLVDPTGVVTFSREGPFELNDLFGPLKSSLAAAPEVRSVVAPVVAPMAGGARFQAVADARTAATASIPVAGLAPGEVFLSPQLPPTAVSSETAAGMASTGILLTTSGLAMVSLATDAGQAVASGREPASPSRPVVTATPSSHLASYASHRAASPTISVSATGPAPLPASSSTQP
ncbi:MAG TPA: redoxin domain-containing protein, partial [Candidatus Ozemobacteraceae bacterium]